MLAANRIARALDAGRGGHDRRDRRCSRSPTCASATELRAGTLDAVDGVDLTLAPGEVAGARRRVRLGQVDDRPRHRRPAAAGAASVVGGTVRFDGQDLTRLGERRAAGVRGRQIGLVPQDPTVSLNPVTRIGAQVAEVLRIHGLADRRNAAIAAVEALERAGIPDPAARARQYPHELSGGMRQRVLIAIAVAAGPASSSPTSRPAPSTSPCSARSSTTSTS